MSGESLAITLGLLSALTLAIVNTAVKRGGDILVSRAILSSSSALIVAPAAFFVPLPNSATLAALAIGVPAHWIYQGALVRAMHRGELSLIFPIMRGLSPVLTAFAGLVVLGETFSPLALLGLLIATGAVLVFAIPPAGTTLRAHPDRTALFWAVMTAIGVALYNVADARGMRIAPEPFTYIVWLFLLDWIGITTVALSTRRRALVGAIGRQWRYGVLAGALSVVSFGAALYAFTLTEAARVAALRETAVVFGALLGWLFLKEKLGPRRVLAALILAAGLVLMQMAP